jgi:type IV secretory pathway TraG/TraD family ATPase VirD4
LYLSTWAYTLNVDTTNGFDVVLGLNKHHGSVTNIGLTAKEREQHVYIIGGTGNGKTTMLQYAIVQDIRNGKGVAVVDPHGDMAKTILKYIPEERIKDVIYLNPIDIKHPIGLNLLELPTGLDEDDLLIEKGRVTSSVVSVMRKVFSDDEANAHRIEAVMRNAVQTALTVEGATLFTVLKLLRNEKFRKEVVAKLDDENLKDFWREEIGQAGEMQLVGMTKGVTQRIDRFNTSEPAKRMLGQSKSTINFEDIMDSGKILICNLGDIEEDESELFGTTILAKLKMAAERRARMPEDERKPFYVYADEFQNFATTPFVKMLSSSRKFKLFLTIAEQSTKQQEKDRLTQAILANVSTAVCFRTGSPDDEDLMLRKFEPFIEKGAIGNLPAYSFYIRIQAGESLEPMSGITLVLPEEEASEKISDEVIEASRDIYAITYVKPVKTDNPREKQDQSDNEPEDKDGKDDEQTNVNKNQGDDALSANDDV